MYTNQTDITVYTGNSSNVNFPIPFVIMDSDVNETLVILRDNSTTPATLTVQTFGSMQNYTLTGANPPTTPFNNNVQMNVAPTPTQQIIVMRSILLTQPTSLLETGPVNLPAHEHAWDRMTAMLQFLQEQINRSVKYQRGATAASPVIPEPVANYLLAFNAAGTNLTAIAASAVNIGAIPFYFSYASDAAFVTAKGNPAAAGDAYVNTTYEVLRYYNGSFWVNSDGTIIATTKFNIVNNQASAANVTGCLLDGTQYRSARVEYNAYRNFTGGSELAESGVFRGAFKSIAGTWEVTQTPGVGDAHLTFSWNNGQLQYVSTNESGTATSQYVEFRVYAMGL